MDLATLLAILDSTLRLATPLLFACLAGLFSERSGIFDIGLEGKMLIAAFFSAAIAATSGSVWLGLLAGIAASLVLSGLHGLASIPFRGDQLISGVAINFLAAGLTVLIAQDWFSQGGRCSREFGRADTCPIGHMEAFSTDRRGGRDRGRVRSETVLKSQKALGRGIEPDHPVPRESQFHSRHDRAIAKEEQPCLTQ